MDEKWGEWAFLLGVLLAIVVGLFSSALEGNLPLVLGILAVLGLIVGFLNISEKEVNSFLIAAIALLTPGASLAAVVGTGGLLDSLKIPLLGNWLGGFLGAIGAFVGPAAIIVALKAIYALAAKK